MPPLRLTHRAVPAVPATPEAPEAPHRLRSFQRTRASAIKKPSMESATGIGTMGATRLIRIPRRQLLFGNVRPAAGGSDLRGVLAQRKPGRSIKPDRKIQRFRRELIMDLPHSIT